MTNTELETYRRQLLALQNRLNTDVSDLANEALGKPGDETTVNLSHAPIHMADQGTDSYEQQFTLSLMENEAQTLGEITAALERIEQRGFGRCEECQETIPQTRLDALPYTRHCVECARKLQGEGTEGQSS
jgi:RNA polymerase-binding transcription factor DksA